MALREIEQHRVKKILGAICNCKVPTDQRSKTRLSYEIEGDEIILIQENAFGSVWAKVLIALIRYNPERLTWQLYWNDGGKWKEYITEPTSNLQTIVDEIEKDPAGVFWGEERP